jgi:hypothetical protein
LNEPDKVLEICRRYRDDDWKPEVAYGKVLTFFHKHMRDEATKAAEDAVRRMPAVAGELVQRDRTKKR